MASLTELTQWEASIYQLETTDPVKGGNDGISNLQGKQLANRTAYLKQQVELNAPLESPIFTGTPEVPTAAADTSTKQAASTAFVVGQAATVAPVANGVAAVGTSKKYARQDHVHPAMTDLPTETSGGVSVIATSAEVAAGANDAKTVTPKKLRFGFSISLGINGYIAFPIWLGGIIIQWCSGGSSTSGYTNNFPVTFPTTCWRVIATSNNNTSIVPLAANILSTSQFKITSASMSPACDVFAIGN